jgi:phosphoribosylformylglycinamidine synthase
LGFAREGDEIALVGPFTPSPAASELAKLRGEALPDGLPAIDIAAARMAQTLVRDAVRAGAVSSAHDIAEGGLAIALAECSLAGGLGAQVSLEGILPGALPHEVLFGEAPGGFLISASPDALRSLATSAGDTGVALCHLGSVAGDALRIAVGDLTLSTTLSELTRAHDSLTELFP